MNRSVNETNERVSLWLCSSNEGSGGFRLEARVGIPRPRLSDRAQGLGLLQALAEGLGSVF